MTTGTNTAKGVAGGLDDVARNEALREDLQPSDRPPNYNERALARCLRVASPFKYRRSRKQALISRRRDKAVVCRTAFGKLRIQRQPSAHEH